jgi:hypothetical protein
MGCSTSQHPKFTLCWVTWYRQELRSQKWLCTHFIEAHQHGGCDLLSCSKVMLKNMCGIVLFPLGEFNNIQSCGHTMGPDKSPFWDFNMQSFVRVYFQNQSHAIFFCAGIPYEYKAINLQKREQYSDGKTLVCFGCNCWCKVARLVRIY